jgi:hypothetical protein
VLAAWLTMLDAGRRPKAVGNSDSHRIVGQERGASRTWVFTGSDDRPPALDAVVQALEQERRVTASTGPFLDLRGGSGKVEVELLAPEWMPIDNIQLYGGDPQGIGFEVLGTWRPGSEDLSETVDGGLRRWLLSLDLETASSGDWLVAVARGTEPMLPWSEGLALAVTNPLDLAPLR